MGTPAYMSPEQARGDPDIDAGTDIFSLGVMTYQMLSGALPFQGNGKPPLHQQIIERAGLKTPPASLSMSVDLKVLPGVDAALARALEADRNRRTQSAMRFIEELEEATCR